MNRRNFLQQAGTYGLGALTLPQLIQDEFKRVKRIGIQLYTVRDDMKKDPLGTLRTLSEIGYTDVESAGYNEGLFYGMKPAVFKKELKNLGLKINSGHIKSGLSDARQKRTMRNDWEGVVADAAEIGQKYLVLPYMTKEERKDLDAYKKACELLNKCGETANKYGLKMTYHNHDFEFMEVEGKIPYDIMLAETDPKLANFELDLYWITKAGKDPLTYFQNHANRFPLWHVKDMEDSEERFFTEVGNGTIKWEPIFKAKKASGMKCFYVEQDICRNHKPLESARISFDYLTGNFRY